MHTGKQRLLPRIRWHYHAERPPIGVGQNLGAIEQPNCVYQSTDFHQPFYWRCKSLFETGVSHRQRDRVDQRPRQREYFVRGLSQIPPTHSFAQTGV